MMKARLLSLEPDTAPALAAPAVGRFRPVAPAGLLVRGGEALGELLVLGTRVAVLAPPEARGVLRPAELLSDGARWVAVDFDTILFRLDADAHIDNEVAEAAEGSAASGDAYRAPLAGRFYARPAPGEPPFVEAGARIETGQTLCLLEVMKTFNRVVYEGEPVVVAEVAAGEGADVDEGDVLFRLVPA